MKKKLFATMISGVLISTVTHASSETPANENSTGQSYIASSASTLAFSLVAIAIQSISEKMETQGSRSNTGTSDDSGTKSDANSTNSATSATNLFRKQLVEQVQNDALEYQATSKTEKSTLLLSVIQKAQELNPKLDEDTIIKELLSL